MLLLALSVTALLAFVVMHLLDFVSLRHCSMAGALGPGLCMLTSDKIKVSQSAVLYEIVINIPEKCG